MRPVLWLTAAALLLTPLPGSLAATDEASSLAEARRYLRMAELNDDSPERSDFYLKAEQLAAETLASDPLSADANFVLFAARGRRILDRGRGLSALWQLPSLKSHLSRALELDPEHPHALAAMGALLLDLPPLLGGNAEDARRYLEKAVALNPTGSGTRIALARALLRQGLRGPAIIHLQHAAHYACLTRRASVLAQADGLLTQLKAGAL